MKCLFTKKEVDDFLESVRFLVFQSTFKILKNINQNVVTSKDLFQNILFGLNTIREDAAQIHLILYMGAELSVTEEGCILQIKIEFQ